ncbi:hypothetical protein FGRMN_6510 [Fusarium graminum]|nr:hypothetical protein FGRMN_6510 [Fusarium graminum]
MAQNKATQDERPPSVDQRSSYSGDNESEQTSQTSRNNQADHSGTEQPIQPQTQQPQPASQGSGKKSSAPRVRLDMDLDMELQLKAKIQGDLELAVLLKVRCDRKNPCSSCHQRGINCTYPHAVRGTVTHPRSQAGQAHLDQDMLDRLAELDKAALTDGIGSSSSSSAPCANNFGINSSTGRKPASPPNSSANWNSVKGFSLNKYSQSAPSVPPAPSSSSLAHLVTQLPPFDQANLLFGHFITTIHPMLDIVNGQELSRSDELLMLFSIFAGAALSWTPSLLDKLGATEGHVIAGFQIYYDCALSIVDNTHRPLMSSTTAIAAVTTLAFVGLNADDHYPIRALTLRDRCLSMCRSRMVHRMDSPSAQKERTQKGFNAIELEVQRRVWWNMVATDWLTSFSPSSHEGMYTFIPRLMKVNKPQDVNDSAISAEGFTNGPSNETRTDMTFFLLRLKMAEVCREIVDTLPPVADEVLEQDYNVILGLDNKLQNLAHDVPDAFKSDLEDIHPKHMSECEAIWEERPYIHWQRINLHLGIHARICRLHRPYLLEAYSDRQYTYSRTASIHSARKLLKLRRMMDHCGFVSGFEPDGYRVILQHVISAALTLALDVSWFPRVSSTKVLRQMIMSAYEIMGKSGNNARDPLEQIENNIKRAMTALQKQDPIAKTPISSLPGASASGRAMKLGSVNVYSAHSQDINMNDVECGRDEYSYQLWSDFLAMVPDLEKFEWRSLSRGVDFVPDYPSSK